MNLNCSVSVLGLGLVWGHGSLPSQSLEYLGRGSWEARPPSFCLLEHVDEVAGNVGLARLVRLEVTQDAVLALAPKGCLEQLREGRQTVWVVGEPEFTATGAPHQP